MVRDYKVHAAAQGDNTHTLCGLSVTKERSFDGWRWDYTPPLAKYPANVTCCNCLSIRYQDRHP